MKKQKIQTKPRKVRDWLAVLAHFRTKKGPYKDQKKEENKMNCRKKKIDKE